MELIEGVSLTADAAEAVARFVKQKVTEEVGWALREPLVVVTKERSEQLEEDAYDAGFTKGLNRGKRNMIYYLSEIEAGRLEMSAIVVDGLSTEEKQTLTYLVERLRR